MAITQTVREQEAFIAQLNGDYNIPFTEATCTVAGALPAGTVLADAATVATAASTTFYGILAKDKPAGTQRVRIMVRGNPSTVSRAELNRVAGYDVVTSAYAAEVLAAGIIAV